MHQAVRDYVAEAAVVDDSDLFIVEIGSRNINGTVRDLFPGAEYVGVDIEDGKGVDVVADAKDWAPPYAPDVVLCLEVFEHTPLWEDIIDAVAGYINGVLIVTCAAQGRKPHSAVDGGELRDGEFYRNLTIGELKDAMVSAGFEDVDVRKVGDDLQARGVKYDG